jgi:tetratricopeptide (TPR) repeat protein
MTRALEVPATRVRRWLRLGLIKTSETRHRFAYFGFAQLAAARKICELTDRGLTLQEIQCALERMRRWLPDVDLSDPRLRIPERGRRLVASLDGRLIEEDGQLSFDFKPSDSDDRAVLTALNSPEDLDALFDKALELEDAGQLTEAAEVYRKAIEAEPADPVLHFNLANVLFAQARFDESAKSYRRALDSDPFYAEAWNNLGNAYAELKSWHAAIAAFRKAIQLVPTYRDAHENLARALEAMKQIGKARVFSDD